MIALLGLTLALVGPPKAADRPPAPTARTTRNSAQGVVRSAGQRTPVAGARVFASARSGPAWTREAITDDDGRFVLADLPSLDFRIIIVAADHQRLEQPTTSSYWRKRKPPTIFLQPTGAGTYRTIVSQERSPKPTPFSVQLSPEEIAALPGSQGDPLRALQNLPGSARVPGGLGLIVLRGATPNQSQVFVGEHPVPRAFHIPGLASIVPAGVLSGLQYVPSNFAANYGNAVGGLVVLQPRVGRRDGVHGYAKLDIISAGALVEGPVGRGSLLVAAQRGYLDLAIKALGPEILGTAYLRPKYGDYQVVFDHPAGQGGTVTARILGGSDILSYRSYYGGPTLALSASFHRLDLVYRKRHQAWDFMLSPALRFDRSGLDTDAQFRNRIDTVGLLRAEATGRLSRRFQLTIGGDTQIDRHRTLTHIAGRPNRDEPDYDDATRGVWSTSGLYLTPILSAGKLLVSPGLRASLFAGPGGPEYSIDPRLHAEWTPHERVAVKLGAGRYSMPFFTPYGQFVGGLVQSPIDSFQITDKIVFPGAIGYLDPRLALDPRSRLGLSQAAQLSGSVHVKLTGALGLDGTVFWRRVRDRLPLTPDQFSPNYRDQASVTYGVEVMLRHDLTHRLFGWVAYTWMNSRRGIIDLDDKLRLLYPADFDQRHNLVAVLGYKLPRRWQIGGRFRVVTGLPYTPNVGGIKFDGIYPNLSGIAGEINSGRMPVFHQLDVRIDKTWVARRAIVSAYLDVQNVYNRQNPEGLWYLNDFSATRTVVGVPILPVLGVRVDY